MFNKGVDYMPYKVLYRKYRPNKFSEIVGQETIVNNLKNSVMQGTFSHAYIFTGPRGTGKTSTAKVLAKAINCTNLSAGEICCECENCLNFNTSPDIIEIDAASNNGVDEIRELKNNISLTPTSLKYKVYIIDEVHMLSTGAFNALLKTLEEPPPHAIFILATTEVYKVPITILSRCQRYDFKKIEKQEMIDYLKDICKKEQISYDEESLEEIYLLSEGCLRDALSILDQVSKENRKITQEVILNNYNIISNRDIDELLASTIDGNIMMIIDKITEFEDSGMNPQKLIKRIINYLENIAINIKLNREKRYKFEFVAKLIKSLNECYIDARINENIFSMIKLSFLELCNTHNNEQVESIKLALDKDNDKESVTKDKVNKKQVEPIETKEKLSLWEVRINNCFVDANKEDLKQYTEKWLNLDSEQIDFIHIENYKPVVASSKYLIFTAEESSLKELFNMKIEEIEKVLTKNGLNVKVIAITTEDWNSEKEKYKTRIRNGYKYKLIDEKVFTEETSDKNVIEDLFKDKLIEES